MALQKNVVIDKFGVIENAYIKVLHVQWDCGDPNEFGITYGIYRNKTIRDENIANAIETPTLYVPIVLGSNIAEQAYNSLKQMPDFSGAVDC